ncbi:MAG: response regulator [Pirellulales bacterium]
MPTSENPAVPDVPRTVFVVDDDPGARQSVAALIKSRGMPVQTYASGEEFLAAWKADLRGVVVMDVRMTGISGLDVQQELRARGSALPIIIITGFADVPMAVRAMHQGAVTFLEKPCADQELWKNVEMALEHEKRIADLSARKRDIQARHATLTPGELQVLDKLMRGDANKTIAAELDMGLRTVEMRRATIMKKMHAESLAELVREVLTMSG